MATAALKSRALDDNNNMRLRLIDDCGEAHENGSLAPTRGSIRGAGSGFTRLGAGDGRNWTCTGPEGVREERVLDEGRLPLLSGKGDVRQSAGGGGGEAEHERGSGSSGVSGITCFCLAGEDYTVISSCLPINLPLARFLLILHSDLHHHLFSFHTQWLKLSSSVAVSPVSLLPTLSSSAEAMSSSSTSSRAYCYSLVSSPN